MGTISNFVYGAGILAGSLCATDVVDKDTITDLLDRRKVIHDDNPYEEVMAITAEEIASYSHNGINFRLIPMDDIGSWKPYEILAKMMYTERVNPKDEKELRLIAATAIHMALYKGKTIREVTLNKKAYSGVMRKKNKRWMAQPKRIHLQVAYDMIEQYKNSIPEEWSKVMFFCNEAIVKKTNARAWKWFKTLTPIEICAVKGHGTHTFYSSPKFEKWKAKNPRAMLTSTHLS